MSVSLVWTEVRTELFVFVSVFQVLCVGNLYNPDVRYSFSVPVETEREAFVWDASGPWQECSRMCQGKIYIFTSFIYKQQCVRIVLTVCVCVHRRAPSEGRVCS